MCYGFTTAPSNDRFFQFAAYVAIFRSPCSLRWLRLRTTKQTVAQMAKATQLTDTMMAKLVEKDWDCFSDLSCSFDLSSSFDSTKKGFLF